jgi:hypothetical protein
MLLPPDHCTPYVPAVDFSYEELVPFAAVPPTLEHEENRIGDSPRQIRRNSAVLFINQNYSRPVAPVILYSISNSLNLVNRVSSESNRKESHATAKGRTSFEKGLIGNYHTERRQRQKISSKEKANLEQKLTELTDIPVNSVTPV